MLRVLELAELGRGKVSPNPMVGCVIVHNDKIIGEGWHRNFGSPHAEVNAIDSVKDKSLLPQSTLYVNLEPCAHVGKTPPCADLIIKKNIKKVVIANLDPNPLVAGKGVEKLKTAGCKVQSGMLEDKGYNLNKRFFTFHNKQRPFIILKWAETQDGFIARFPLRPLDKSDKSKWISNELSRKLVHKWRAEEDAIMIGTNTAKYDDPKLNTRHWSGKDPVRIVIDRERKLSDDLNIFDNKHLTICYNAKINDENRNLFFIKIHDWDDLLEEILKDLYNRNIQSLLVEGGGKLLQSFIDSNLWDEIRLFKASKIFGKGIPAPVFNAREESATSLLDDRLMIYAHGAKSMAQGVHS